MVMRERLGNSITYLLLVVASVCSFFPIFWMISVSLRPNVDIFRIPPAWIPTQISTEAYQQILNTPAYLRMFMNSYLTAFAVTVAATGLATLAGYAFSRFDFRGSHPCPCRGTIMDENGFAR